jgi:membrane protein
MNAEIHRDHGSQNLSKPGLLLQKADMLQRRRAPLAVAVATWKKFIDDQAGNLAALVAYFGFASMFPLLLVGVTILNFVLHSDPNLRNKLLHTTLRQYPVIGPELARHASGLGETGLALVIGSVLTLFSARGVAVAMQNAMNAIWGVPQYRRPGFPWSLLRSLGLMAVIGPGVIATITLSGYAGGVGHLGAASGRVAATAISLLLNLGLFWLGFRLATSNEVSWRDLLLSAVLAAIGWQVLQLVGGYFIGHELRTTSAYGVFAVVLGLLTWFYVQAQLTMYAAELNVVRVRHLWPRSLNPPPLTDADMRCYHLYADASQVSPEVEIDVQPSSAGRAGRQTGKHRRQ